MKKELWRNKYINTLRNHGLSISEAIDNYISGEHNYDDDPVDAAMTELSYMREESEAGNE